MRSFTEVSKQLKVQGNSGTSKSKKSKKDDISNQKEAIALDVKELADTADPNVSETSLLTDLQQTYLAKAISIGPKLFFQEQFDLRHIRKKEVFTKLLKEIGPYLKQKKSNVSCFISYAWAEENHPQYLMQKYHEYWVAQLAILLQTAGITVYLDRWEDKIGKRINKFISKLMDNSVIALVIGTKLYLEKYQRESVDINKSSHVVKFEAILIENFISSNELQRERVFPLLVEGTAVESFPSLIRGIGQIPCIFVTNDYFKTLFKLIHNLYALDNQDSTYKNCVDRFEVLAFEINKLTSEQQKAYEEVEIKRIQEKQAGVIKENAEAIGYFPAGSSYLASLFSNNASTSSVSSTNALTIEHNATCEVEALQKKLLESFNTEKGCIDSSSIYIPAFGLDSPPMPNDDKSKRFPLSDYAFKFLTEPATKVLLLLGGSGSGKTSFCVHLAEMLCKRKTDFIPIFVSLISIKDKNKIKEEVLEELRKKDIHLSESLQKQYKFLWILDGYDEIQGDTNLIKNNHLATANDKVIITCRYEYLASNNYRILFLPSDTKGEPQPQKLWECHVAPFSSQDIESYLQQYIKLYNPPWKDYKQYCEQIDSIPNLKTLVETPFLLYITAEALPKIVTSYSATQSKRITRITLYEEFINRWLERNIHRLKDEELKDIGGRLEAGDVLKNYCKELAFMMYAHGIDAVQKERDKEIWTKFFSNTSELNSKLRIWPRKKVGAYTYSFLHKSILEYFIAVNIIELMQSLKLEAQNSKETRDSKTAKDRPHFTIIQDATLLKHPFNNKLLNPELSVIRFLAEAILEDTALQNTLWGLIEHSKWNALVSKASANAATLLNASQVPFTGRNLKGVKIPGANLSYGVFDSTDFTAANCRDVEFRGAWLANSRFVNANMQGNFGEWPYLKLEKSVNCCCYSADGQCLVLSSYENIYLFDAKTQALKQEFKGHTSLVNSIALSSDDRYLASGSWDNTARLWEVATGKTLQEFRGNMSLVNSVALSSDDRYLASGSDDNTGRLWEVTTGRMLLEFKGHTNSIRSVVLSSDDRYLVSGSVDNTARLWEVATGKMLQEFKGHTGSVNSVALSSDDRYLASGSDDNTARLWEVATGKMLQEFKGHTHWVFSIALSSDGRYLASGSADNTARLWEVATGKMLQDFKGHTNSVNSVALSSDGRYLASGSEDKTARLWEVAFDKMLQDFKGHTNSVNSVALSSDGRYLASGSSDKTTLLWEVATGKMLQVFRGNMGLVNSVALSSDDRYLASGSDDNTARLWEVTTAKMLQEFKGHTGSVYSVALSNDCRYLASGSVDKTARLWEVATGKLLREFKGHTGSVLSIALSSNGRYLVSGSWDTTARLWEVGTGKMLQEFKGHTYLIRSVALSSDGRYLVSGSGDNTARLWEVGTGKMLQEFKGHTDRVRSVALSSDGRYLASGSGDKTARLWDTANSNCLTIEELPDTVHSVSFLQNATGNFLATGSSDGSVRCYRLKIKDTSHSKKEVVEKVRAQLLWNSHPAALNLSGANFESAILSPLNAKLLKQREASGKPREILEQTATAMKTGDIINLIDKPLEPQQKPLLFQLSSADKTKDKQPSTQPHLGPKEKNRASNVFTL